MRIQKEDAVAICVDFQERLVPVMEGGERAVARAALLCTGLERLGVPLIVSRQYPKGLGDTVPVIREATQAARVCDKTAFSCYGEPELRSLLDAMGKKTAIVFGIEAHICVLQTATDLLEKGWNVVYVTDCVDSRKSDDKKYAIKRAAQEGARLATCESILFELLENASSPVFKEISRLIK